MSGVSRTALKRGTAYVGYASATFETRDDIILPIAPAWERFKTSMFGPIDAYKKDNVIKLPLRLWGAWENLSILFPSYLMSPIPGTSVFGTSDSPLTIQARNADLVTLVNAQITGMSNLYLGTDSDLFAADVEFTAILANSTAPETASSYTTIATNAYSAATEAFAKTNFKRVRFLGAWTGITGYTAIIPQKGVQIGWTAQLEPVMCDGYGTVDMSVQSMIATAKLIPIQPTLAQVKANNQEETQMGTLASTISADLVFTGNGGAPVITLKAAYLKDQRTVFSPKELRVGEHTFETTTGFSTGAPQATATVA